MSSLTLVDMKNWWNESAKVNAASAVLSNQQNWDMAEFFKSGDDWAAEARRFAESNLGINGAVKLTGESALDFGSGLGRMTRPWAASYAKVTGVDISSEMVDRAYNEHPPENVNFIVAESYPLPFASDTFDLSFSAIVLQHIPAPHSLQYITELLRIIKPGGYSLFDIPIEALKPIPPAAGLFTLSLPLILMAAREVGCILLGYRAMNFDPLHPQFLFQKLPI